MFGPGQIQSLRSLSGWLDSVLNFDIKTEEILLSKPADLHVFVFFFAYRWLGDKTS